MSVRVGWFYAVPLERVVLAAAMCKDLKFPASFAPIASVSHGGKCGAESVGRRAYRLGQFWRTFIIYMVFVPSSLMICQRAPRRLYYPPDNPLVMTAVS